MLSHHQENGDSLVRLDVPNLSWPNVDGLGNQLLSLADLPDSKNLFLDFRNIEFVTGAGLGKLVALYTKVRASGRRLAFLNVGAHVREVFGVTGLMKVFDVRSGAANGAAL
jgi:anti-anti-sigma factor